ncbi:helix-turn-helix domain-containing protein [Vibrio lentus]|uniref:helix-turn-helix domain-containing protein n=1 Tax=Vibrio lentus TaxID=136468 RepID=UPI000C83511B|nr:AraC family transcriptional regulator [Vibrio lentus]PMG21279.1 AraC family transcriptional regulator [Vibrio lentus]PMH15139.1 AraC family transcriptional regulator [Vibrio lentus]PMJ10586.1 AraC family transcriptional regulator [Vibrio lentus]PMK97510.1 AraC family transcriptional regulator [Vibrio lentus]PMN16200.1 AraC family transcriptional regulator [Vibrio lentus]
MINWLQSPKSPEVAQFIDCYWLIEKTPDAQTHQFPILNPDPSAHLILSPDEQAYHYTIEQQVDQGAGCHLLLPHHKAIELDHSKPFIHLGIKFHVGALYSLNIPDCSHPSLDSVNPIVLANLLGNPKAEAMSLIQLAQTDFEACCQRLDNLLLPWLSTGKTDRHSELTRKVLEVLSTTPIAELGDKLFCSQRTLERSFNKVTGLTLKQCQSMNKLEAMLEYLYKRNFDDIDWIDVAYQFGFSDQPHLIRYLKKTIGLTPNTYAKQGGLTIDVYGGVRSE